MSSFSIIRFRTGCNKLTDKLRCLVQNWSFIGVMVLYCGLILKSLAEKEIVFFFTSKCVCVWIVLWNDFSIFNALVNHEETTKALTFKMIREDCAVLLLPMVCCLQQPITVALHLEPLALVPIRQQHRCQLFHLSSMWLLESYCFHSASYVCLLLTRTMVLVTKFLFWV